MPEVDFHRGIRQERTGGHIRRAKPKTYSRYRKAMMKNGQQTHTHPPREVADYIKAELPLQICWYGEDKRIIRWATEQRQGALSLLSGTE